MSLRGIMERLMANPWVYDKIRPIVIGWLDYEYLATFCSVSAEDRILDLGCGTGQLVRYLACTQYLGVDVDPSALKRARRFESRRIQFIEGDSWDDACRRLNPTVVLMLGLVHHLSDDSFDSIVQRLREAAPSLRRIVTFESTYSPGSAVSNLLSRFDRGRYVRRPEEYEALFNKCGLRVVRRDWIWTKLHVARYIGYHLEAI